MWDRGMDSGTDGGIGGQPPQGGCTGREQPLALRYLGQDVVVAAAVGDIEAHEDDIGVRVGQRAKPVVVLLPCRRSSRPSAAGSPTDHACPHTGGHPWGTLSPAPPCTGAHPRLSPPIPSHLPCPRGGFSPAFRQPGRRLCTSQTPWGRRPGRGQGVWAAGGSERPPEWGEGLGWGGRGP